MTNKKTRSNLYYGEVLGLGKAKRMSSLVLNPTAGPYEKRLYYSKVFMDLTSRGITRTRSSTSGKLMHIKPILVKSKSCFNIS